MASWLWIILGGALALLVSSVVIFAAWALLWALPHELDDLLDFFGLEESSDGEKKKLR